MTFDDRSETNIASLTPNTQAKARAFLTAIAESKRMPDGWAVKIISGLRDYHTQQVLFDEGRKTPGKIVTNAPPGYSNHNFGIAFDLGIFNDKGQYIDDLTDTGAITEKEVSFYYRQLVPLGKALGLEWGGDWVAIDDEPHWELNPWPELSESAKLSKLRAMTANGEPIP